MRKTMFGYPALFVSGNMFAGTYRDSLFVRLPEDERAAAMKRGAKPFEPMPGRPMKEYVVVPAGIVAKPAELASWIERGLAYAARLPVKQSTRRA